VIGNGDIVDADSARDMLSTGCDSLMIGRGALGNPFIFEEIKAAFNNSAPVQVSPEKRLRTALYQLELMCENKPQRQAVLEARTHFAYYFKGLKKATEYKKRIFAAESVEEINAVTEELISVQ